jgi:hypothetical protein
MRGVLADIHNARNKFQSALEAGGADLKALVFGRLVQAARATKLTVRGIPSLALAKSSTAAGSAGTFNPHLAQLVLEVGFDFRTAQALDPCVSGDPGIQCPMGTQAQGGEQVGIADTAGAHRLMGQDCLPRGADAVVRYENPKDLGA